MDERELLGQHGTRMYQVPHQRLSTQAAPPREAGRAGRVGPEQGAPPASVREVQSPGLLLPTRAITLRQTEMTESDNLVEPRWGVSQDPKWRLIIIYHLPRSLK